MIDYSPPGSSTSTSTESTGNLSVSLVALKFIKCALKEYDVSLACRRPQTHNFAKTNAKTGKSMTTHYSLLWVK